MDEPMPVEEEFLTPTSPHNFTNEQHKKQDEEVTLAASKCFAVQRELCKLDCAFLLNCIIERSEGKLWVEYTDLPKIMEYMDENPKLEPALKKAWRTKDYKEIRESGEPRASSLAGS
jgi:hypothetical protein